MTKRRGRQGRRPGAGPARKGGNWRLAVIAAVLMAGLGAGWLLLGRSSALEPERADPPAPWLPARGSVAALEAALQPVCADPPPRHDRRAVTAQLCRMEPALIELVDEEGKATALAVLVADSSEESAAGYQFIGEEIIAQTAILFPFPQDVRGAFHMCNVRAPLDMIWFRSDGSVLDSVRAVPGPPVPAAACRALYSPEPYAPYRYVLETPAGALEALGMKIPALRLRIPAAAE